MQRADRAPFTAVAVFTRYRPRVDEYETVRIHARISASRRTLCGVDLQKAKWELTRDEPDCKRCLAALSTST